VSALYALEANGCPLTLRGFGQLTSTSFGAYWEIIKARLQSIDFHLTSRPTGKDMRWVLAKTHLLQGFHSVRKQALLLTCS